MRGAQVLRRARPGASPLRPNACIGACPKGAEGPSGKLRVSGFADPHRVANAGLSARQYARGLRGLEAGLYDRKSPRDDDAHRSFFGRILYPL